MHCTSFANRSIQLTMTTNTTQQKPAVIAYTDGACSGNPGPGGWGVYMENGTTTRKLYGSEAATTNNRMELMAAIKALEFFPTDGRDVSVFTDSQYVKKGITEWLPGWIAKGWKGSKGKPVMNVDLWQRLQAAAARHHVTWQWVKGHAGNAGNEKADALATQGVDQAKAAR